MPVSHTHISSRRTAQEHAIAMQHHKENMVEQKLVMEQVKLQILTPEEAKACIQTLERKLEELKTAEISSQLGGDDSESNGSSSEEE